MSDNPFEELSDDDSKLMDERFEALFKENVGDTLHRGKLHQMCLLFFNHGALFGASMTLIRMAQDKAETEDGTNITGTTT